MKHNKPLAAPVVSKKAAIASAAMTYWLLRDRRDTKVKVVRDVVEGKINMMYFNPDAAERDRYITDAVWEVEVRAAAMTASTRPKRRRAAKA